MKQRLFLFGWLPLVLASTTWVALALAQQTPTASSQNAINQAIMLLNNGNSIQAEQLLATIGTNDVNYGAAKCYDALCLYEQNNKKGFLKAMQSPAIQGANIPAAIREVLEFDQIDALFFHRRFDELSSKINDFKTSHSKSADLGTVGEYQLAGVYERGLKKIYDSCIEGDTNNASQLLSAGTVNLEEFLALASSFGGSSYRVLTNRTLKQEVWTARITLGNEQALLNEIPVQATADREQLEFLGVKLFERLQPATVDNNLQRMKKFINDFPGSSNRTRVEFDRANISFSRAEAFSKAADAAELSGDANTAITNRALARYYFSFTRKLQDSLTVNPAASIEKSDVLDREDDLLHSYYLEKNYGQVISLASELIQNSTPGDLRWMMAKDYRGISLTVQTSPDLKQAASELDAVLALGFNGRPDHDHHELVAAKWRIYIAHLNGNDAKAAQIVQWVQNSVCTKNQKVAFFKTYSVIAGPQNNSAK